MEAGIETFRTEDDLVNAGEIQTVRNTLDTRFTHGQAPRTALMEAGGIDVWAGLRAGTLNFTTYRKQENEITFAGSIPDEFLWGMTPVTAEAGTAGNTAAAELEASKRAGAFGGLIPLPLNQD